MAERQTKLTILGREVDVTEVPIKEMDERSSSYVLEDGSRVNVRCVITAVLRVNGQFDGDGNPVYFLKNSIVATPIDVPANLRKSS